jgi:hypothetical protein
MDQFQVTPDLERERQNADKAAMVQALFGDRGDPNQPYPGGFEQRFAGDAELAQHQGNALAGNMLNPLVDMGFWHRHQGSYPPAKYPSHYDFINPPPPVATDKLRGEMLNSLDPQEGDYYRGSMYNAQRADPRLPK